MGSDGFVGGVTNLPDVQGLGGTQDISRIACRNREGRRRGSGFITFVRSQPSRDCLFWVHSTTIFHLSAQAVTKTPTR